MSNLFLKLDIAFRMTVLLLVLSFGVLFIMASARAALAATLKPVSIIEGDVITVADVFEDAGEQGARVLGPAPAPGQDMVLNARTLWRIALSADLPWKPMDSSQQSVLRRAATIVDENKIRHALVHALSEKGVQGKFDLSVAKSGTIALPANLPATVEVVSLNYNAQSGFFEATVAAPSAANPVRKLPLTGEVRQLVAVPVLNRTIQNGDVIRQSDISIIEMPAAEIQAAFILKTENLEGMTARRIVLTGKPVRADEVTAPRIVSRSDEIVIVYKEGPLTLTAKGRALQDGSRGDIVRVVNLSSSKTMDALITGTREVTVN